MKNLFLIFSVAALFLFISGSTDKNSYSSYSELSSADMVVFHEHTNYGGKQIRFYGASDIDIPKFSEATNNKNAHYDSGQESYNWNDKISSIMIGKNKCLTVWKDTNYGGGDPYTFKPSGSDKHVYRLPSGWGDKISSAKIRPVDNCAK